MLAFVAALLLSNGAAATTTAPNGKDKIFPIYVEATSLYGRYLEHYRGFLSAHPAASDVGYKCYDTLQSNLNEIQLGLGEVMTVEHIMNEMNDKNDRALVKKILRNHVSTLTKTTAINVAQIKRVISVNCANVSIEKEDGEEALRIVDQFGSLSFGP